MQTELAERLSKAQSFVSKYERGERRLDFIEFIINADALGLGVSKFVEDYRMRINKKLPLL